MSEEQSAVVEDPKHLSPMEITSVICLPMALKAALKLNVFEILAKHGNESKLSADEIMKFIPSSNPKASSMLDRVLVLLSSQSLLSSSWEADSNGNNKIRRYGLTPDSKWFVNDENGNSLGKSFLYAMTSKVILDSFQCLDTVILEGGNGFVKAHGKKSFDYMEGNPMISAEFNSAMSSRSTVFMKQLLQTYDGFKNIGNLVDVGGGIGSCLNEILQRHAHMNGINFDQPYILESAPTYPRMKHVGGNMFENVPSGDAIFLKSILHDWNDEDCIKLLSNCSRALPDHGKVIVVDHLKQSVAGDELYDRRNRASYQVDIMLLAVRGSKQHTEEEVRQLALASGFSQMKVMCIVNELAVMELYK